ncbi:MAG TPA: N-6 DNA methylase [Phycisphaerales bacterium]|nr:N-6 DNA methylase [Phycisphaerales bacterium]HRQ75307.1 N-6 DNA methylase [Phycisphaerales bacterium]
MPVSLLEFADSVRREVRANPIHTRAALGQFMTPASIAAFMARMVKTRRRLLRVLDPGAGVGSLTAAIVERLISRAQPPLGISVTCYEIDGRLVGALRQTLETCRRACTQHGVSFTCEVRNEDYIAARTSASSGLFAVDAKSYECVIMNPPYRKIHSASAERQRLRSVGIETTNLYAAFMLLAARQLAPGGEFVSISPRSFCNGTYFDPFRRELLRLVSLRRLHVFESRSEAFRDDDVLQENIVVHGIRSNAQPPSVTLSCTRTDGSLVQRQVPFAQVVRPGDRESIVHVAVDDRADELASVLTALPHRLTDLKLTVSTGRVVDFRARTYLRPEPVRDTVPLIYPAHMHDGYIKWPNGQTRKPNAIVACEQTNALLIPSGYYVLVKRFSAKEERRRIVAAMYDPTRIPARRVGFDNKTNYFHAGGSGMDGDVARGLAAYLNSKAVDDYFRVFSGHTQVNAADLRRMPYPSLKQLRQLGTAVEPGDHDTIDAVVRPMLQSAS